MNACMYVWMCALIYSHRIYWVSECTRVTANNSINNNVVFFYCCFRFENNILYQLLCLDHNALDKRGKIFFVTTYLETKIIQNCLKPINTIIIYHWDKRLKRKLHVLKADLTTNIDFMFLAQRMHFFTRYLLNDHHCAYLSNKSLSC